MLDRLRARVRHGSRPSENERGLTLVELLIYMILLGLALTLIIGVIITTMKRQHEIVSINQANNKGQQVLANLGIGVGNATEVKAFAPTGNGSQLLITKTRGSLTNDGDSGYQRCIGYFYDATTGKLHSMSTALGVKDRGPYVAAQNNHPGATTWPVLAQAMKPNGSNLIFNDGNSGADLDSVRVTFEIMTYPDREPVIVDQLIRKRGGTSGGEDCWP